MCVDINVCVLLVFKLQNTTLRPVLYVGLSLALLLKRINYSIFLFDFYKMLLSLNFLYTDLAHSQL